MTDGTSGEAREQPGLSAADEQLLRERTERARASGLKLTGEGGLLGKLTKMVVEGALEGEMDDHLGYAKPDPAGRDGGNSRNGHRAKTVLTNTGPVEISVPRDRDSSFEPKIVAKRQRRLTGLEDMVISLSAKGLTHRGDLGAPAGDLRRGGLEADHHRHHRPGDGRDGGMAVPAAGPGLCGGVHRRGARQDPRRPGRQPARLPGLGGDRGRGAGHPGPVAGKHGDGEGAKSWLRVLSEIKNRGTGDVLMLVCDGLRGLPDAVSLVWEKTMVQTCIVHLLRNSFKYASKRDWAEVAKDLFLRRHGG